MARTLRDLPLTSAAFGAGELSFSKVRALTRVATPRTEESLVSIAKNATAAHVERIVAGLRKVSPDEPSPEDPEPGDPDPDEDQQPADPAAGVELRTAPPQRLRWRWDEQTDELVLWGRFGAADGKVILAALTRAELERIRTQQHREPDGKEGQVNETGQREGSSETIPSAPGSQSDAADRTAPPPSDVGPALVALAQIGLSVQEAPAHAATAEVIYLHGGDLHQGGALEARRSPGHSEPGVVRADEGPALDQATGDEVLCGAAARCVMKGAQGAVLAYGRKRRLFSATQLKALRLRDGCCQTPGCGRTRFLHAHHVVYWWHGGLSNLDNAVLLCSACHRSVHLGRLRITGVGDQQFKFVDAETGEVLLPAPPISGQADRILAARTIGPRTVTGGWFGEPLDLSMLTADLIAYWRHQATTATTSFDTAEPTATDGSTGVTTEWGPVVCGDEVPWDDPRRGTWEVVSDPEEAA